MNCFVISNNNKLRFQKKLRVTWPGFPYWGDGEIPPPHPKFAIPPLRKIPSPVDSPHHIFIPLQIQFPPTSYCSCSIFVLISYSLDTQVMSILILTDVQYSYHIVIFSFEKGLNCQNHSSSGSLHLVKKSPQ